MFKLQNFFNGKKEEKKIITFSTSDSNLTDLSVKIKLEDVTPYEHEDCEHPSTHFSTEGEYEISEVEFVKNKADGIEMIDKHGGNDRNYYINQRHDNDIDDNIIIEVGYLLCRFGDFNTFYNIYNKSNEKTKILFRQALKRINEEYDILGAQPINQDDCDALNRYFNSLTPNLSYSFMSENAFNDNIYYIGVEENGRLYECMQKTFSPVTVPEIAAIEEKIERICAPILGRDKFWEKIESEHLYYPSIDDVKRYAELFCQANLEQYQRLVSSIYVGDRYRQAIIDGGRSYYKKINNFSRYLK